MAYTIRFTTGMAGLLFTLMSARFRLSITRSVA